MAWIAVNSNGHERIHEEKPYRWHDLWVNDGDEIYLPKGTILKLIGRELSWEDEPVELTEK